MNGDVRVPLVRGCARPRAGVCARRWRRLPVRDAAFCLARRSHAAAPRQGSPASAPRPRLRPPRRRAFTFPEDHGPHPDFRIEWWYVTANLTGADGRDLRHPVDAVPQRRWPPARQPGLDSPQVWMGHAGLTTPDAPFRGRTLCPRRHRRRRASRSEPFDAWIDEWRCRGPHSDGRHRSTAQGADFAYDPALDADGPFVPQGDGRASASSRRSGQASHYYSQPFYRVSGTLTLPEGPVAVTGQAWLDREWSSQPLAADQTGWDWFSLPPRQRAKR